MFDVSLALPPLLLATRPVAIWTMLQTGPSGRMGLALSTLFLATPLVAGPPASNPHTTNPETNAFLHAVNSDHVCDDSYAQLAQPESHFGVGLGARFGLGKLGITIIAHVVTIDGVERCVRWLQFHWHRPVSHNQESSYCTQLNNSACFW